MERIDMINKLVDWDIEYITRVADEGDFEYLADVLSGNGWKPYGMMTDRELKKEYKNQVEFRNQEELND